jgi:RNA recognition motif-containing protein
MGLTSGNSSLPSFPDSPLVRQKDSVLIRVGPADGAGGEGVVLSTLMENESMSTKLYVGNLSFAVTEVELMDLFSQHGTVNDADLVVDKFTQRPRGFAFVTMETPEMAKAAVNALNGQDFRGRPLVVNEARPKEEGGGGGYRGGGGGGGGGYRGGGGGHRGGGGGGGGHRGGGGGRRSGGY